MFILLIVITVGKPMIKNILQHLVIMVNGVHQNHLYLVIIVIYHVQAYYLHYLTENGLLIVID